MTIDSASGVNSVLLLVGRAHSEEEKLDYKVEHSRLKCADKAKSVKPLECVPVKASNQDYTGDLQMKLVPFIPELHICLAGDPEKLNGDIKKLQAQMMGTPTR